MKITKVLHTETGHRLTTYPHKCACLHGHSYKWEVTIESFDRDEVGFVMDYKDLKKILEKTIGQLDHGFLFHKEDPLVKEFGVQGIQHKFRATHGGDGRIFVLPFNPTSENILDWVAPEINDLLPDNIWVRRIKMWETASSYAVWNGKEKG